METTKVVVAQSKSRSLRTTIPVSIARILGIEEGTELGWDLQAKDNQFLLTVRVLKGIGSETLPSGHRRKVGRP